MVFFLCRPWGGELQIPASVLPAELGKEEGKEVRGRKPGGPMGFSPMMVVLPRVDQWKAGVFLFSEAQCFLQLGVLKAVSRDKHYAMLQKLRLPNLPFLSLQSIDPLAELSVPCAVHNMPSTENSWKNAAFLERNLISLKIFLPPMHLPIFPRSPQAGSKQPPVFTVTHVESHKHRSQSVSVRWK